MKKILMTLAAAFVAVSMSAQVYVGGQFAFASVSGQKYAAGHADQSETTFKLLPEIGYNLNDEWAIGVVLGYESNKWDRTGINDMHLADGSAFSNASESAFIFNPYARYTFLKSGKVNLFVDGGVEFASATKGDITSLSVGFKPGLAVNLTESLSFVSHVGFVGYDQINPDGDDNNYSAFGLDLSGANLTFGLYYNF